MNKNKDSEGLQTFTSGMVAIFEGFRLTTTEGGGLGTKVVARG